MNFKNKIWILFQKQRVRKEPKETERGSYPLPINSPNICHNWGLTRAEARSQERSTWLTTRMAGNQVVEPSSPVASHMHISRKLESKARSSNEDKYYDVMWEMGMLIAVLNYHFDI